jgi:glycosyltransferase involved in cell wall biosynthesis
MKLVSVVIPAYNVAEYIGHTLKSLLDQLAGDIEIIVVDDGSTDDTARLTQSAFTGHDSNHCKLIRQQNLGVSAARNAGLRAAEGQYVLFLDGDDTVSASLFSAIRPLLADGSADICCWKYCMVNPDGTVFRTYEANLRATAIMDGEISGKDALENILIRHSLCIWTGSAVYRRDFLTDNKLDFYIDCRRGQDVEFIQKALLHADKVRFIGTTLSFYLQRPGSAVHSFSVRRFDAVCGTLRTSESIGLAQPLVSGQLAYLLRYQRPVEDFLFVTAYSMINFGIKNKALNRMIDDEYPQLRSRIAGMAKDLSVPDRFRWIYLLYRRAPLLFAFCVRSFSRFKGV